MIVNIEPLSQSITQVQIRVIDFNLMATSCVCEVAYMSESVCVRVEKVDIPEEIYTQWGTDDSVIVNYVLQQLNLIAAEE